MATAHDRWREIPLLAAVGMLAAALQEERLRTRRRTRVLVDVARALVEAPDPRQGVVEGAVRATDAEWAFLLEPARGHDGQLELRAAAGPRRRPCLPLLEVDDGTPPAEALSTGRPVFVRDPLRARAPLGPLERVTGAGSLLAQPVSRRGQVVGVLVVSWPRRLRRAAAVEPLVELVAASAALAIERSDMLARAQVAARTDALTDLANRRAWDSALPRELARASRQDAPVTVAVLDLDRFKAFNDSRGHQAGDDLLREAARRWGAELRATDLLARYGGEEFAVLLPATPLDAAAEVVERLRGATPGGQTCSAGMAAWNGAEGPEQLVERADRALYEAKRAGRDQTWVDGRDGSGPEPLGHIDSAPGGRRG